jgi:hypothetical protein
MLSAETKDPKSGRTLRVEADFPLTPGGIAAKIWSQLGMLAVLALTFIGVIWWVLDRTASELDGLRLELKEARVEAAAERRELLARYDEDRRLSRDRSDKRHGDYLARLGRIELFMEWVAKNTSAAVREPLPKELR